ncbi:hypothetical protein B0H13DRAFT_1918367 [Mycena leptocephala]|nr:hypothetical protein B0H13DRAFT_1918367 [Mycena leptocephala]
MIHLELHGLLCFPLAAVQEDADRDEMSGGDCDLSEQREGGNQFFESTYTRVVPAQARSMEVGRIKRYKNCFRFAQCLLPGCAETQDEASDEVRASGRRHRSAKVNIEGRAVEMSITSAAMYSRIPDIKQLKFEAKLSKWADQNCEEVISRCDQEELLTHILSGSCSGRALSSRR